MFKAYWITLKLVRICPRAPPDFLRNWRQLQGRIARILPPGGDVRDVRGYRYMGLSLHCLQAVGILLAHAESFETVKASKSVLRSGKIFRVTLTATECTESSNDRRTAERWQLRIDACTAQS